jgi:dihydroceramide fatty acyl 2-hydroxylase
MNVSDYQRHQTARMFESDFFEFFSKVHPATPFVFYIPLVGGLYAYGLAQGWTNWVSSAIFIPLGYVTWCVLEYVIHRYFFHWEGSGPFTRKLHDIVHGYHHRYPDDTNRLVMPLGASIPLALVIGGLLYLAEAPMVTLPYYVGIVGAYLLYDYLHWATHAVTPKTAWGRALRSHHMAHHFACPDQNFGISHRWLDVLIGSRKTRPVSE